MAVFRRWRPTSGDRRVKVLVLVGLAVSVSLVYVVIVLGGGLAIGQTDSPNVALSVLATAIVALGFEPAQDRLEQLAARVVLGGRASPYDVLSRFSETVMGTSERQQLPSRMAQVLAEGTGAEWAQVWLMVNERPVLAATWPPDRGLGDPHPPSNTEPSGRRSLDVLFRGEPLGVLRLQEQPRQPLTPVEERLFAGLAAQAGLVLRGASLRAELAERRDELSTRSDELRHSRERLVDTQDDERRRLERDIHDGAQQHLVALAVNLRLGQTLATRSPARAAEVLAAQVGATDSAIETLVDLSRGIYPRTLTDEGIAAALRTALDTHVIAVHVEADGLTRYADDVEAAVYFCCLEAIQNAAKHSGASEVSIRLRASGQGLAFTVDDNGSGFDIRQTREGEGLANMRDRVDALGGQLSVSTGPSGGTRVAGWVAAAEPGDAR